jgi:hypothetical protein
LHVKHWLVILAFLALVAVIVHGPLSSRAEDAATTVAAATTQPTTTPVAVADATAVPATQPTTAPSTQPLYKVVRGHEGFWRIVEDQNGAWWFLSPTGKTDFLNTVTTVQPFQKGRDANGPAFVSADYNTATASSSSATTTDDLDHWAQATLARVHDTGFKGLGAWCHPIFHKYDVPITRDLNVWDWVASGAKRLYSPEWSPAAEAAIKAQCEILRDNKNLVGYYTDNELDWGDGSAGPSTYFDHLPKNDPNREEVLRVIESVWTTPEQFNKDWRARISDWKDVENWDRLPRELEPKAYTRLFTAWLSHMTADYFRITTTLVHKYDPNHLVLGVRFRGYAPPEVVRAAAGYTDAQSLNYYVGDARLDLDQFRMMYESGNQPVIISEYSFHALDGRSGDRNLVGFNAQVPDQQARADGYHLMTTRLARIPYVIGADWFQWMDEPPSGRSSDGEDVNFGIVDIDDRPYPALAEAVRTTTPLLNDLHAKSPTDEQQDVWRESFATKPVAHVPFLTKPISINGELSDWAPEAKLAGVRLSQTIGLDRSRLPLPNVYLAWNYDGLYLGLEVFDNDIEGASAKAWWWTKDNVEFWISTKPVASDQNTYDVNCHQFFFVPNDLTASNGVGGVVGQWHREGDAINDNIIPQADIRSATRILPDRYVVEMFIPAKALHGWDPKTQPAMAFNLHIRNFQHAIDYFWSAPKEVMTQFRPNTWGPMYLEGAPTAQTAQAAARVKPTPTLALTN